MKRALVAALFPALTLAAGAAAAEDKAPTWDEVFSLRNAPKGVHLKATYADGKGASHDLEIWRDGDRRLRRRTDTKLDLFAEKTVSSDYAFRLVDLENKRIFEVNRTNLYRIGVFTDWPALAGILVRPRGPHALRREARPVERTPAGECRWIQLTVQAGGSKSICWSDRFKVPLVIQTPAPPGGTATTLFQVKQIEAKVPEARIWKVPAEGFLLVSADQDIDPSSDL
jgi:hypothetical protein